MQIQGASLKLKKFLGGNEAKLLIKNERDKEEDLDDTDACLGK